jgi:hypothetical protein
LVAGLSRQEEDCAAAARAALRGLLARVQAAAARAAAGGWDGGVYRPRRGEPGASLRHFSRADRAAVLRAATAEMCLFKYQTEEAADEEAEGGGRPGLGLPLDPAQPHALYLRPADGEATAPHQLNVGPGCLRPKEDARGWRVAELRERDS